MGLGPRDVRHVPYEVQAFIHGGQDVRYTRQMLSIVASGSDASHETVVNGFFYSALVVVRELS